MVNSIAMTVPLAFEPKSPRVMQRPPRNPREALLSRSLVKRILVISIFNWILIFGVFEWMRQTGGNIDLARTMAIQALVAGRVFYLLSISQLGIAVINRLRGIKEALNDTSAVVMGITATMVLQIVFSQWNVMNILFKTAPLNLNQWLICFVIGLPMIFVATFCNRFDSLD